MQTILLSYLVNCDSPLQIVMAVWHTFLKFELPVRQPADNNDCLARFKFKKVRQTAITI